MFSPEGQIRVRLDDPERFTPREYAWCELCGRDKDVVYDKKYHAVMCPHCDPARSSQKGNMSDDLFLACKMLEALHDEIINRHKNSTEFDVYLDHSNAVRLLRGALPPNHAVQYTVDGKAYRRPNVRPGTHERRREEWESRQLIAQLEAEFRDARGRAMHERRRARIRLGQAKAMARAHTKRRRSQVLGDLA